MTINLTLVVQAINFLIAYIMIKKLFLKPAVEAIEQDDADERKDQEKITIQKEIVVGEEKRLQQRLSDFRKTFLEHEPEVAKAFEIAITPISGLPSLPAINEKQVEKLAKQTADHLIEKVAHVH